MIPSTRQAKAERIRNSVGRGGTHWQKQGSLSEFKLSLVYTEFQNSQGYIQRPHFKNKVK